MLPLLKLIFPSSFVLRRHDCFSPQPPLLQLLPSFFIQLTQPWPGRSCQDQLVPHLCVPKTSDQYLSHLNISPSSSPSHVTATSSTVVQEGRFLLSFLCSLLEAESLRSSFLFPHCKGLPGTSPGYMNPFDSGAVSLRFLVGWKYLLPLHVCPKSVVSVQIPTGRRIALPLALGAPD